ncbi:MAG: dTDP-4-dehydrorhamnose reductase [Flavobacterium sp.]|nr:dTDP-4-dehydrorhamnose reductase [Flavobacterium sp.]
MVVLVTGASGQLGMALQHVAPDHSGIDFHFASSAEADITNKVQLSEIFDRIKPEYCINAAAYTAVDKAESQPELAKAINVEGARNLAEICKQHNTVLIHISTDFVFDGQKNTPYTEDDLTNPQSVYGQTKRDGELAIQETWGKHIIIRTSWLYSQFGNNFMKTMLRMAAERDTISVVNDQIGTPTNAVDLAEAIIHIAKTLYQLPNIQNPISKTQCPLPQTLNPEPNTLNLFGIYHFSNQGECSWFDFAKKIFEVSNIDIDLRPITTAEFPTAAKRPGYSVLDKGKIGKNFGIKLITWTDNFIKDTPNK